MNCPECKSDRITIDGVHVGKYGQTVTLLCLDCGNTNDPNVQSSAPTVNEVEK